MSGPPTAKKRKLAPESSLLTSKAHLKNQPQIRALIGPHKPIIDELSSKYDILPVSVISSSQITKRVTSATTHLLEKDVSTPRIVLLHARARDVGKLITVGEQVKRVVKEEGAEWWQYNELLEDLEKVKADAGENDVVEETVLEPNQAQEGSNDEDEDDDFEVMPERFEKAISAPPTKRITKSLRVFLAVRGVPELKAKATVTVQASTEP